MASPVSIGDAILLAKIAYNVGKAFTSGAKSAPSEFLEIQALLTSISESLTILHEIISQSHGNDEVSKRDNVHGSSRQRSGVGFETKKLEHVLEGLQPVLLTAQEFVEKYSVLNESKTSSGSNSSKADWKFTMRRSWRKVLWSKESTELQSIKQTLVAHTNSLSLMVAATKWGSDIQGQVRVNDMGEKLDEIHEWFTANLQLEEKRPEKRRTMEQAECDIAPDGITFTVYEEHIQSNGKPQRTLICPTAASSTEISNIACHGSDNVKHFPFLRCDCPLKPNSGNPKHSQLHSYTLLPISLLVQLASPGGKLLWHIYAQSPSSSSPASLVLSAISPAAHLQMTLCAGYIALRAGSLYPGDMNESLIKPGPDSMSVSVLRMRSEMNLSSKLLSTTFQANDQKFPLGKLSSMHALHYTSLHPPRSQGDDSSDILVCKSLPESHFAIQLTLKDGVPVSSTSHYEIQVNETTELAISDGPRFVTLRRVTCIDKTEGDVVNCDFVTFEFTDTTAATEYLAILKDMKQKLLLCYLQGPRVGEALLYQRPVGDVMVGNLILSNATWSIVTNHASGRCRMILLRGDASASACYELPESFLRDLGAGKLPTNPTSYPVHFTEVTREGIRITQDRSSFLPVPVGTQKPWDASLELRSR